MKSILAASLFGSAAAFTEAERDSGIKKVITLLGELKTKVENETAQGEKDAVEYEDWCIKTTAELKKDVEYGGQKTEELSALLEDGSARAAGAAQEVQTLSPQIGKLQEEQKKAAEIRKKENFDFTKEEAELAEADTMLQKAYAVLKRSLSFVQTGSQMADNEDVVRNVVSALGVIIDAAWIDPESVAKIKSFLEAEDGLELKQPQAAVSNYQSKSGGILDAIQGMQEKNAQVLSKLREAEMSARHKFELLNQDLKNQENSVADQVAALKETEAKATAGAKQAEADLATANETLDSDKKELTETKSDCASAAKEWAARKAEATEEISVITQAIDILSGKFGGLQVNKSSFLQLSSSTDQESRVQSKDAQEYERRSNAAMILRRLSHEYNSFGLMQVAVAAQDDPFVKVRGMIKDMISKLEEEAQKEASKEAKCKADKAKGEKQLKVKTANYNKLLSRSDAASAKFTKLGEEVKELQNQLTALANDMKEATQMRNKQRKDNEFTIKDSGESIEALTKAIEVLSKFYGGGAAFVQTGQPQTDTANVIMEILATSQEDFEKLKQTTEAAEADAQDKYEKMKQAAEVTKARKTAEMDGKSKEKAGVKVMISQITEDLGEASKALEAASSFLKGVKEQCANKAMSYEERKKRREAEVKGLEEALQILSSDESEFLQLGFMSKKN